jgi:hypothetical protein
MLVPERETWIRGTELESMGLVPAMASVMFGIPSWSGSAPALRPYELWISSQTSLIPFVFKSTIWPPSRDVLNVKRTRHMSIQPRAIALCEIDQPGKHGFFGLLPPEPHRTNTFDFMGTTSSPSAQCPLVSNVSLNSSETPLRRQALRQSALVVLWFPGTYILSVALRLDPVNSIPEIILNRVAGLTVLIINLVERQISLFV